MTEPPAEVVTTEHEGRPLIRVRGEVDMANADLVGERIREVVSLSAEVVLDLEEIEFFDSSALHMLHRLSAEFDRAGGRLTVAARPGGIVGRLLTITRMDSYLHMREPG
jgi:anti-anti-sigma factor